MKKLLVLVLAMAFAGSAFAVVDPDPNMVGIYFDMSADTYCTNAAPYGTVPAYLMLTNPDFDALYGFEVGYTFEGNGMVLSTVFANAQALDVGGPGNHIVGFGAPSDTQPATLLATLSFLYMATDMSPVVFNLMGTDPSSNTEGLPTMLLAGGQLKTTGFSTIDGMYCAVINGVCEDIVDTDDMSFDGVKSLYR
jgi:hypothetical protein